MAIKYYNYKLAAGVSRIAMFNNKLLTQGMITTVFSHEKRHIILTG